MQTDGAMASTSPLSRSPGTDSPTCPRASAPLREDRHLPAKIARRRTGRLTRLSNAKREPAAPSLLLLRSKCRACGLLARTRSNAFGLEAHVVPNDEAGPAVNDWCAA